ncbi:hypothetical protein [Nannocystis punicea]|uniref:Uncharacterized protein n=1 Tax=Nannocystis punicea TaxID=2995304 RepID=A0ABY7H2B3_9BACT|nr:hypothetical protein [Nannocystis poenicansa]WAS93381.1 hypothetical protein O0S08_45125 [Nannocystis poenicansa]
MSVAPLSPKRSRLSTASAVLAVIPLLAAVGLLYLPDGLVRGNGLAGDIVWSLFELTLLCVPLALPMGMAAISRHLDDPARPGLGLALLGTLLSGAELLLLILGAHAPA